MWRIPEKIAQALVSGFVYLLIIVTGQLMDVDGKRLGIIRTNKACDRRG
jgi:hypothetical protein